MKLLCNGDILQTTDNGISYIGNRYMLHYSEGGFGMYSQNDVNYKLVDITQGQNYYSHTLTGTYKDAGEQLSIVVSEYIQTSSSSSNDGDIVINPPNDPTIGSTQSSSSSLPENPLAVSVYKSVKYFGNDTIYIKPYPSAERRYFKSQQTTQSNNIWNQTIMRQYSLYNGVVVEDKTDTIVFFDQQTDGSYKYRSIGSGYAFDDGYGATYANYYILEDIDGNTKYYYTDNSAGDSFGWLTDSLKTVQQVDDQYYDRWETLYDDDDNNDRDMYDISTYKRVSTYCVINGNYVDQVSYISGTTRYVYDIQPNSSSSSNDTIIESSSSSEINPNPNPDSGSSESSTSAISSSSSKSSSSNIIISSSSSSRIPVSEDEQNIINRHTFAYIDTNSIYIKEGQPDSITDYENVKLYIDGDSLYAYNFDESSTLLFESKQ